MDGVATRGTDRTPYIVECFLCAEEGKGQFSRGWIIPPGGWFAGDRYFVCGACADMVRKSGVSIVYSSTVDSNLRLSIGWGELKDGKDGTLWSGDVVF